MSDIVFYILCGILSVAVLIGIAMMSKVKTAVTGNRISAIAMVCAIALVLVKYEIISVLSLWICMALGLAIGILWAYKVKMIEMPQMVALLNGFGGIASAIVGTILMVDSSGMNSFELITAALALVVGIATFTGSMVAAGKLHKVISQKPIILKNHQLITVVLLILSVLSVVLAILLPDALFVSTALTKAEKIFNDGEFIKSETFDIPRQRDVYESALRKEQESIDLYKEMKNEAKDPKEKEIFELLIKQETEHYNVFEGLIELLTKAEDWVESAEFGNREDY
jgi:hypothetical protein